MCDIKIECGPCGQCPVQVDGTIDDYPFYFRARGNHWALYVSRVQMNWEQFDPFTPESWKYSEPYKEDVAFAAGWMGHDEAEQFIKRAAEKFVADMALSTKEGE